MRLSIVLTTGLLSSATPVAAEPARFEMTPFAGWQVGGQFDETVGDTECDVDGNASYGVIVNMQHEAMTQWELYLSRQATEFDSNPAIVGVSDFELRALATVMDNDTGLFCLSDAEGGICAVEFDGSVFWQVAANAGFTFRFD